MSRWSLALLITAAPVFGSPVCSAAAESHEVTIRNHMFEPAQIVVPAHAKVRLHIRNADSTAEEFESTVLHVEKVIPGNSAGTLWVGPLSPGRYGFFGDFHPKTAQGSLIVK